MQPYLDARVGSVLAILGKNLDMETSLGAKLLLTVLLE